jgi:malonyl CoA-acyl carrier protein transacylase
MAEASTNSAEADSGTPAQARSWEVELLIVRAADRAQLADMASHLAQHLEYRPDIDLTDLAFTLNTTPEQGERCLAVLARSVAEARSRLMRAAERLGDPDCKQIHDAAGLYYYDEPFYPSGQIALLFPGEGAQYPGMLKDVGRQFPDVASFLAECDELAARAAGRSLTATFLLPDGAGPEQLARAKDQLSRLDNAMLSVLMADMALYRLLRRLGVRANFMAGHSMGELAALWAADALETRPDFVEHLAATLEVVQRQEVQAEEGAVLLAVGAGREAIAEVLAAVGEPPVFLAMDNCRRQTVVVGPPGPMAAVGAELKKRRLIHERLPFRRPYHTPLFKPMLGPFDQLFEEVRFKPPRVPVYSCTTAQPFPQDPKAVRELALAHWASPVHFTELIENLYAAGARVFVEAGPRGNLSAFVEDILAGRPFLAIPTDVSRRPGLTQLCHLLGQLAAHDVPVQLQPLYEHRSPQRLDLPLERTRPRSAVLSPLPEVDRKSAPASARPRRRTSRRTEVDRAQAMGRFLEVMDQFLVLQRKMTEEYLAERPRSEHKPGRTRSRTRQSPRREKAAGPARPMLGERVRHVLGAELVLRRSLDLSEDRYAADHTLGGRQVSKVDPDQHGLPVVPMTFTLEMMAEAADALLPGRVVTGLRRIQLFRWLEVDEADPVTVEVTARRVPSEDNGAVCVEVEVRDLGPAGRPATSPVVAARGLVILRNEYPAPPPATSFQLTRERPSNISLTQMYLNLFHGPMLQGVRGTTRIGDEGIESAVEVLKRDQLFRSYPQPSFLIDPVMLDVVMHPLASWHLEHADLSGRILLPVGAPSIELFGPPAPPGARFLCRGVVSETTVRQFTHEVEVLTDDGRVWARMNGVRYWRFYVPFGRVNFHGPKDQYFLSRRWTEIEAQLGDVGLSSLALMRLDLPPDLRQAHVQRILARVMVTPDELQEFRRQSQDEKKAAVWLTERIAAKDAVRTLWRERQGERLFPADIQTASVAAGLYIARRRATTGDGFPPVAVASAGGSTAALAAGGASPGLALAQLGDTENGAALEPEEAALVDGCGPDREDAAARFRCARQAVAVALALRSEQAARLRVRAVDATTGAVSVAFDQQTYVAHTARDGAIVVALALIGRDV